MGLLRGLPKGIFRGEERYSFVYDVDDEMGASRGREKLPCFYSASGSF